MITLFLVTVRFVQTQHRGNSDNSYTHEQRGGAFSNNDSRVLSSLSSSSSKRQLLQDFRREYRLRYGLDEADGYFQKAVQTFGDVKVTAKRLLHARASNQPFVMAFAGYSVTVGRGNYFHQSFPFVLERLLGPLLQNVLGVSLEVRNAAIGGIPSFPYGFCLPHFVGKDADVVSWDYSMNEGKGAAVLESYIRHTLSALPKQPLLIVLDTNNAARSQLLGQYTTLRLLHDAMTLKRGIDVIPKPLLEQAAQEAEEAKRLLQQDSNQTTTTAPPRMVSKLPVGLQNWTEFGAPNRCPGRSSWHPKLREHEFMGYVLAMHFVNVMEKALDLQESGDTVNIAASPFDDDFVMNTMGDEHNQIVFPLHLQDPPKGNPKPVTQLLYGHPVSKKHHSEFVMKQASCRTSFLPAQEATTTLPTVVVSGLIQPDLDMMEDRSDAMYEQGWVLDVSKIERDTKKKVQRCGGLGYIDMKVALYGIPQSGTLRLFLPFEGPSHDHHEHGGEDPETDFKALHWMDDLILCEANEKRGPEACQLHEDLEIKVGGSDLVQPITHVDGAGVYLNRKTCVHVAIPPQARVTQLSQVTKTDGTPLTEQEQARWHKSAGTQHKKEIIGLQVDITPKTRVTRKQGACCLSHIIWEQH